MFNNIIVVPVFIKGVYSKRKEFAPFRVDLFSENRKKEKLSHLPKIAQILSFFFYSTLCKN